jgi:hypothetical protein
MLRACSTDPAICFAHQKAMLMIRAAAFHADASVILPQNRRVGAAVRRGEGAGFSAMALARSPGARRDLLSKRDIAIFRQFAATRRREQRHATMPAERVTTPTAPRLSSPPLRHTRRHSMAG